MILDAVYLALFIQENYVSPVFHLLSWMLGLTKMTAVLL